MFSLAGKAKAIEKLAIDNSPALLTAVGVVGTVTTAVLTHRAALKADLILQEARIERHLNTEEPIDLTAKDKVHLCWTTYAPPVVAGTVTIGAIVFANRIGTKRAAAVATAYALSEKAYTEYKDKVIEKFGQDKHQAVRDEIAQEHVARNPQSESNVVMIGTGDVLCYELYTDRYFRSSMDAIKKAVNEVNYQINTHGYASLSDFYNAINIPTTATSDEQGWNSDKLMDIDYTSVLAPDGQPCLAINFITGPGRNHDRFH
jgi:hypothetical protein